MTTSHSEPAPTEAAPANPITPALRDLVALVLLGANAVLLLVAFVRLFADFGPYSEYSTWTNRAGGTLGAVTGLWALALPLVAVLITVYLAPRTPQAKLITLAALAESPSAPCWRSSPS